MKSTEAVKPESRAKAEIYSFLATVFGSHPSEESFRAFQEVAALTGAPCPSDLTADALEQEYMAMFVIPGPRYVAPYESVFRDRWQIPAFPQTRSESPAGGTVLDGLLMGDSTVAVRRCFSESSVLPEDDLPDHFANELRLLAHLWRRASEDQGAESEKIAALRREVRDGHLLEWVGALRRRVEEQDSLGYYSAAVEITEGILESDRDSDREV